MMLRFILISALAATIHCQAADKRMLSVSPDKQIAIVEERAGADRDYYFLHRRSGKRLGYVLPPDQRGDLSNVDVIASWNRSSTMVALLVFYGTKLSELLLYHRGDSDLFSEIALRPPDPVALYRRRTGKTIPQPGDGGSVNAVGPWLDDDTVALVSGEAKQTKDPNEYCYVFARFRAHIHGRSARIFHVHLIGPLSYARSERFEKHWGQRYFETRDEWRPKDAIGK